jgi:plastocyanin
MDRTKSIVCAALLALWACGGDGPTDPAGPPTDLAKVSGDEQTWFFSNPLPEPYEVVVLDANGRGVPGIEVAWIVASGGGTIAPTVSTTNEDGVASATHTLGPSEEVQSVVASALDLIGVEFSAFASDPPTSGAVTIDDNFFSPTEVVVQVGGAVTWTWVGDSEHNVIFTGPAPRPADSPTLASGTYVVTFTAPAVHSYVCNLHLNMSGTVRVVN